MLSCPPFIAATASVAPSSTAPRDGSSLNAVVARKNGEGEQLERPFRYGTRPHRAGAPEPHCRPAPRLPQARTGAIPEPGSVEKR